MFFTYEKIEQLNERYYKINPIYEATLLNYIILLTKLKNNEAKEYIQLGFLQRLNILRRCLLNIWTICPPENRQKLSEEALENLSINLHSFIFNTYGCLDNLAWVWIKENKFIIKPKFVGLGPSYEKLRKSLPPILQNDLIKIDLFFNQLENFRHALAHRIPLFVFSQILNKNEESNYQNLLSEMINAALNQPLGQFEKSKEAIENLGKFAPIMTHSSVEKSPQVSFHHVTINFLETVMNVANQFYLQLENFYNT